MADPSQLENVILNLAVNATDAMPQGGRLTIETANAHIDDQYALANEISSGQYVLIAVTHTGIGMGPDIVAKAFDPFFTTKGVGQGTGLGLSQIFGVAKQSGGHVKIYSEVAIGTTIKLYLPRSYNEETTDIGKKAKESILGGRPSEIILVVEDEDRVRSFAIEALRDLGYTVMHASNGSDALKFFDADHDVTLLFTDIVMPGMTARQLVDAVKSARQQLKVFYMTGYSRNGAIWNGPHRKALVERPMVGVELADGRPIILSGFPLHVKRPGRHEEILSAES
jgi:CheY-like chemotaxis protein